MNKSINYSLFFIMIAVVVLAFGIISCSNNKNSTGKSKMQDARDSTENSNASRQILENPWKIPSRQSKLNFSEITEAYDIGKNEITKELQIFVLEKSFNQTYQKIIYSDGKHGYLIGYSLAVSDYKRDGNLPELYWLSQEYVSLARSIGFRNIFSSRTSTLALLEFESQNYIIRIEQSHSSQNQEIINVFIVIAGK